MKRLKLNLVYEEYEDISGLTREEQHLLKQAQQSINIAYAPYSGYQVGAALLLENGEIITGNNQENVAYPSGLCAERVALFYAQAQYPEIPVKMIAVAARSPDFTTQTPVTPCGSCRQVIAEHEDRHGQKVRIIMRGDNGKIWAINGIENLLPLMFRAEQLKKIKS